MVYVQFTMQITNLKINGMSCDACASHVKKALEGVPGVQSAAVNLGAKSATVEHTGANTEQLLAAVAEEGYEAEAV